LPKPGKALLLWRLVPRRQRQVIDQSLACRTPALGGKLYACPDCGTFHFAYLQHVLPAGFHRVRHFGWLHPAARVKLNRIRALLNRAPILSVAERAAWQPPTLDPAPPEPLPAPIRAPLCPKCRRPMRRLTAWLWFLLLITSARLPRGPPTP
jgi:hypothetical protein